MKTSSPSGLAFIGCAGVPNRYGGFEAFVEHCGPHLVAPFGRVVVTCDARLYGDDHNSDFRGMERVFIGIAANGASSVLHDLLAFVKVFSKVRYIVVLGVSGGIWFPLFRLACALTGRRLLVNVDGVEWRRSKFSTVRRGALWAFDRLAQVSAHRVVYDNLALAPYLSRSGRRKAVCIEYSGDHARPRGAGSVVRPGTALTICRIEPENNIEMLIEGVLRSSLQRYVVVGNWAHSNYGRRLMTRFAGDPRLSLLDPVYDPARLQGLRGECNFYLHGHSVGGTNPSLVEMIFYDCELLCFDVPFNRETAGGSARYFRDADELATLLNIGGGSDMQLRKRLRDRYSAATIADRYRAAICDF
jgi:glycosyltransferase involved in cell wall biosynthesis